MGACSGHGTCRSNRDFALDFSEAITFQQNQPSSTAFYEYFLVQYENAWDSGMNYGCLCDIGFRGPDCSLQECSTYMDPMDEDLCDQYQNFDGKADGSGKTVSDTTTQSTTTLQVLVIHAVERHLARPAVLAVTAIIAQGSANASLDFRV